MSNTAIEIKSLTLKAFKHGYGRRAYIKNLAPFMFKSKNNDILINKDYASILNNISFTITKNQCFGILDDNVTSMAELPKVIVGIVEAEEGTISVNGSISVLHNPVNGFVNSLTVMENIYIKAALHNIPPSLVKKTLNTIVEFSGIELSLLSSKMEYLNSDLRKQLGFAIVMMQDNDIYIINEYTNFGEKFFSQRAIDRIYELSKTKTVVIISKNKNKIKKFCRKMISIESGSIVYSGKVKLYEKY